MEEEQLWLSKWFKSLWCCTGGTCYKSTLWNLLEICPVGCMCVHLSVFHSAEACLERKWEHESKTHYFFIFSPAHPNLIVLLAKDKNYATSKGIKCIHFHRAGKGVNLKLRRMHESQQSALFYSAPHASPCTHWDPHTTSKRFWISTKKIHLYFWQVKKLLHSPHPKWDSQC